MTEKIALCFLTYNNLAQPELWKNFINSKYNIYIHNKDEFTGVFEQYCINNKVKTKYGNISLVKATLKLFKEAFQTKENKYFVLLSDKCIPLYSVDEMYNNITNLDNNLILSYNTKLERYKSLADKSFDLLYRYYLLYSPQSITNTYPNLKIVHLYQNSPESYISGILFNPI